MRAIPLLLLIAAASCSNPLPSQDALHKTSEAELTQTKELLMAQAPQGSRAFAVCGASYGQAVYVDPTEMKWTEDKISTGRFAFVESPEGKLDYLFLDATGHVTSAIADGGEVRRIQGASDGEDATFTVDYPETGVVETYNLTSAPQGGRLALWTSNKPVTVLPAKVAAFLASCL